MWTRTSASISQALAANENQRKLVGRLPELREARAALVRRVEDRDRVPALENRGRPPDVLGDGGRYDPATDSWSWTTPGICLESASVTTIAGSSPPGSAWLGANSWCTYVLRKRSTAPFRTSAGASG